MKSYRVTIKYYANGNGALISIVIPAYNNVLAINKVIDANNLAGQATASKAEEVN
jgi:hypothetical protein